MPRHTPRVLWLSISLLLCSLPPAAQSQQPPITPGAESGRTDARVKGAPPAGQLPDQRLPGSISGTIVDPTGAPVPGASVKLSHEGQFPDQEALTGDDGQFSLANVAPGPFHLKIMSTGFASQVSTGILPSGESYTVPRIALALATAVTEVHVVLSRTEVAEDQIKGQENNRGPGGSSASFQISMSAMTTMPFLSPRSKSSNLPGRPPWIPSASESPGSLREFS